MNYKSINNFKIYYFILFFTILKWALKTLSYFIVQALEWWSIHGTLLIIIIIGFDLFIYNFQNYKFSCELQDNQQFQHLLFFKGALQSLS